MAKEKTFTLTRSELLKFAADAQGDLERESSLERRLLEEENRAAELQEIMLQATFQVLRLNRFRGVVREVCSIDDQLEIDRRMKEHDAPYDRDAVLAWLEASKPD